MLLIPKVPGPRFFNVTVWGLLLVPTGWPAKLNELGENETTGALEPFAFAATAPVQRDRNNSAFNSEPILFPRGAHHSDSMFVK